jgi:hypothetical protein
MTMLQFLIIFFIVTTRVVLHAHQTSSQMGTSVHMTSHMDGFIFHYCNKELLVKLSIKFKKLFAHKTEYYL